MTSRFRLDAGTAVTVWSTGNEIVIAFGEDMELLTQVSMSAETAKALCAAIAVARSQVLEADEAKP